MWVSVQRQHNVTIFQRILRPQILYAAHQQGQQQYRSEAVTE